MTFLSTLHRTPYGQFYANKVNIINAHAIKVPKSVNEVYQEAIKPKLLLQQGPNRTVPQFHSPPLLRTFFDPTRRKRLGETKIPTQTPTMAYMFQQAARPPRK